MKAVSVIIPCRNSEAYLSHCMDSLLRQTIGVDKLELILVDDVSQDGTLSKMLEYESLFPENILVLPLEQHVMLGGARNIALTYASGEYILYLDSDDWIADEAIEKLYDTAVRYDCDVVEFLNRDVFSYEPVKDLPKENPPGELVVLDCVQKRKDFIISERSTLGCWNKLYRTALLKENHFAFAEGKAYQEPAFTYPLRFYENRHYFLNECLHFCYQNPGGVTRSITLQEDHKYDHLKVHYDLFLDLRRRGLLEEYREEIGFYFFHAFFFESLLLMVGRGFYVNQETVQRMQETVLKFFPDIKKNIYLNQERFSFDKAISAFVEMEIDGENIEEFNTQWKNIVRMCVGE